MIIGKWMAGETWVLSSHTSFRPCQIRIAMKQAIMISAKVFTASLVRLESRDTKRVTPIWRFWPMARPAPMKVTHAIMYLAASSDQLRGLLRTNLKNTAVKAMMLIEAIRVMIITFAILSRVLRIGVITFIPYCSFHMGPERLRAPFFPDLLKHLFFVFLSVLYSFHYLFYPLFTNFCLYVFKHCRLR